MEEKQVCVIFEETVVRAAVLSPRLLEQALDFRNSIFTALYMSLNYRLWLPRNRGRGL